MDRLFSNDRHGIDIRYEQDASTYRFDASKCKAANRGLPNRFSHQDLTANHSQGPMQKAFRFGKTQGMQANPNKLDDDCELSGHKVFFKSLRKSTNKDMVFEALSVYGKIRFVRLPYSKAKQANLGYGYVIYEDKSIADYVLKQVKTVRIGDKDIKMQAYHTKSATLLQDTKTIEMIIDKYQSDLPEDSFSVRPGFHYDESQRQDGKGLAVNKQAYFSRWQVHSIKPTHSSYYMLTKKDPIDRPSSKDGIQFRILLGRGSKAA